MFCLCGAGLLAGPVFSEPQFCALWRAAVSFAAHQPWTYFQERQAFSLTAHRPIMVDTTEIRASSLGPSLPARPGSPASLSPDAATGVAATVTKAVEVPAGTVWVAVFSSVDGDSARGISVFYSRADLEVRNVHHFCMLLR